jgi:hypothetical protein
MIPVYFLAALFYNWFVRPKKHKDWERKFMCQRCGALIEAMTVKPRQFTFFRQSPLVGVDLNSQRDKDEGRHIEL